MNSILKYVFFAIAATVMASAQSECAVELQDNGAVFDAREMLDMSKSNKQKLWECPSLQNVVISSGGSYPFIHKLKDVDFSTGKYQCAYYYKESGQYKQTCQFQSKLYLGLKDQTVAKLDGQVFSDGSRVEGLKSKETDFNFNDFNYLGATFPPAITKIQSDFNTMRKEIIGITKGAQEYSALSADQKSVKKSAYDKRVLKFHNISNDLVRLQALTQAHLVDPYLNPSTSIVRKGHTFSNFVAGVITLDPNVVTGYDPNSGEILIKKDWELDAAKVAIPSAVSSSGGLWTKITGFVTSFFGGTKQKEEIAESLYNGDLQTKIYSYAELFENKLWGFYYLLQERFDIGYSALASSLLLLMTAWFFVTVGIGEVIKYHSNTDEYQAKLNETGYIKVVVIIATISLFFLSIPSGSGDMVDQSGAMKSNGMQKNYTLAKKFIRQTAQYGMNTATMFHDLGLSAFIQFVVKRELVMSVDEIKGGMERAINDIYMYSPALELRRECRAYYNNVSDAEFFDSIDDLSFPVNQNWKNTTYASGKNISSIDYNVCMKAYKLYAITPYQIALATATAEEELKNADDKLSEATYIMSYNNIALNEKMGWVSGFGVALEYFILKNNDMFLSEELDNDAIIKKAKESTESMVKDGDQLTRSGMGGALQDNVAFGVSKTLNFAGSLYVHNILPAFGDIQKSIHKYMENVYSTKLQIYLEDSDKDDTSKIKEMIDTIRSKMGKIFGFGMVQTFLSFLVPDITSAVIWHSLILIGSYALAIYIWKLTFAIVFTVLVSIIFLISFCLYFFDLIVHFTTSLFMFVWAFTQAKTQQGEGKIKEWLKNTILIVFLKPSILVFGLYLFIFVYELMMTLYTYVFTTITTNLMATVSLMSTANDKTGLFDSISAYSTVMSMQTIAEVTIDLFGLYFAYLALIKMPAIVFKKTGTDTDDATNSQQIVEHVTGKAEGHHDPMKK